jgi:hypothetical protein
MMRDGIKFKNKDVQDMNTIMAAVDKFSAMLQKVHSAAKCAMDAHKPAVCRLDAGLLLRSTKDLWITCLLAATVQHPEYLEVSQLVYSDIVAKDLDGYWKTKPLLDGIRGMPVLNVNSLGTVCEGDCDGDHFLLPKVRTGNVPGCSGYDVKEFEENQRRLL